MVSGHDRTIKFYFKGNLLFNHFVEALSVSGRGVFSASQLKQRISHIFIIKLLNGKKCIIATHN